MSQVTVVPFGICHHAWCESFYPEGLPASWRLSYFANEFQACCLTVRDVELLSREGEDFADNLPEAFRCILYLDNMRLPDLEHALLKHIDDVIITMPVLPSDLLLIRESYGQTTKIHGLRVDRLPLCHTFKDHAQLHCYAVTAAKARDLYQLKSEVTKWLRSDADEIIVLVDSGTDIVLFRNVTTLVSLLA